MGAMLSDVPNLAFVLGYTNASWTLKADLTCSFVTRLLNHTRQRGYAWAMPPRLGDDVPRLPLLDLSSGYVQRSLAEFPAQGTRVSVAGASELATSWIGWRSRDSRSTTGYSAFASASARLRSRGLAGPPRPRLSPSGSLAYLRERRWPNTGSSPDDGRDPSDCSHVARV